MKKCKGSGKAKDFGCGVPLPFSERNGLKAYNAKYGLGINCGCFSKWLRNSEDGKKMIENAVSKGKIKVDKKKRSEFRERKMDLNVKGAMQLADTYFSRYVRVKNSVDGKCTCFTCGTIKDIKEVDNGHYQKRGHQATRYHLNNCKPQCKTCNGDTKHNGKQDEFRVNLVNLIGEKSVVKIELLSKTIYNTNSKHFRDVADYYRIKVNELQKKLGVKYW
jgi:hypothetical protein